MPVSISAAETTSGLNLPIQDGWNGRSFIAAVPSGNRAGALSKAFPEKTVFYVKIPNGEGNCLSPVLAY